MRQFIRNLLKVPSNKEFVNLKEQVSSLMQVVNVQSKQIEDLKEQKNSLNKEFKYYIERIIKNKELKEYEEKHLLNHI